MIKLAIYDGATPQLEEIAKLNFGVALDALDYAGIKLRDATRKAFRASTTNVSQYYKNGRWYIRKNGKAKTQQALGIRLSHQNRGGFANPNNMANFITSYLMEKNLTMVVAGKHPSFRPKIRRSGKVIKNLDTSKVGAVTKGSYAILQKLNYGDDSDPEYKKVHRTPQQQKVFENMKWRKQLFIEKGRSAAMGTVKEIMSSKLETLLQREYKRMNKQTRKIA